jgi:hypothetical protein
MRACCARRKQANVARRDRVHIEWTQPAGSRYNRYDHARDEYSNVGHSLPSPIARNDSGKANAENFDLLDSRGYPKFFKDGQSGTGDVTGSAKPSAGMK